MEISYHEIAVYFLFEPIGFASDGFVTTCNTPDCEVPAMRCAKLLMSSWNLTKLSRRNLRQMRSAMQAQRYLTFRLLVLYLFAVR